MEHLHLDLAAGVWWVYVISVLLAGAAAWFTYTRVLPPQSPAVVRILRLLRTTGLACLILLLFEPILRIVQSETVRPRVAVLVDGSRSMPRLAKRDTTALRKDVADIVSELQRDFDVDLYAFSDVLVDLKAVDTASFRGFRTNMSAALTAIANRSIERRIGAVLMLTDGQHNGPDNPLRSADNLGIGVYSIGYGDTVMPKDIAISRLLVPSIGVVGEVLPVTVDVSSYRIPDGQYELVIEDNGTRITTERVTVRAGVEQQTLTFEWKPTQDGVRKLSVALKPLDGESSVANNRVQSFVDVRSYKRTVVMIAGSPSPDVTFIKASLTRDPSVTVKTFIQRQGSEFYEGRPTSKDLTEIEAVVLIGYPTASSDAQVIETVAKACTAGTALFFMPSVQVDYRKLGSLQSVLPFRVTGSRPQEFLVTPEVTSGRSTDPIMRITGADADGAVWNALPPVYRTETFVEPTAGAQVLATMRVGNASLEEPLIMKRDDGHSRSIAVLGYGVYRWRLLGTAPAQSHGGAAVDVLDAFMTNSVAWLRVRDSERRIVVAPTQTVYATGEPVAFVGSVQDEAFAAVDDAEVRVLITSAAGERSLVLAQQGSGRYGAQLGSVPPGDYSYVATVVRRGEQMGVRRGRFAVGDLQIEDVAVVRNGPLLSALAQRTSAVAASQNQLEELRTALKNDPRMRDVVRTRDREYPVYHLPWLIVIGILSFAAEWALRKRRGLV